MAAPRKIELIPVAEIVVGSDRLRPLNKARVDGLVATLREEDCPPLLPIEVWRKPGQQGWTLIDGLHRLTAKREIGDSHVEALVHDNSSLTARTVELQRNLFTGELTAFETAKHLAELYYLERAKRGLQPGDDPRKLGGRPPQALANAREKTSAAFAEVSISAEVGRSIGIQERRTQDYIAIFRALSPDVAERIESNRLDLAAAQLALLAKQEPNLQRDIVERLLIPEDHPDPDVLARRVTTVTAALKGEARQRADNKRLSAFVASFKRMALTEKKGALGSLEKHLPAGFVLVTPDDGEKVASVRDALATAFALALDLMEGGEPVGDERLKDVAQDLQTAQIALSQMMGGAK